MSSDENALLLFMFLFAALGLAHMVYPQAMLRCTIRQHQWLADDERAVGIARFIGGGFLLIVAIAIALWARSTR